MTGLAGCTRPPPTTWVGKWWLRFKLDHFDDDNCFVCKNCGATTWLFGAD
jgi:hypothetical protein